MKNKIKLIPLICCTIISVVGFNALDYSHNDDFTLALDNKEIKFKDGNNGENRPRPENPSPTDNWPQNDTRPGTTSTRVTWEPNTNRQGGDYDTVRTSSGSDCQNTCAGEGRCRAFTFVPYSSRPGGNCWLKDSVPQSTTRAGWTSGVKQ